MREREYQAPKTLTYRWPTPKKRRYLPDLTTSDLLQTFQLLPNHLDPENQSHFSKQIKSSRSIGDTYRPSCLAEGKEIPDEDHLKRHLFIFIFTSNSKITPWTPFKFYFTILTISETNI